MSETDVPSPIDLRDPDDARKWEQTAQSRPGRLDVFDAFAMQLQNIDRDELSILELGSGPGFLAAHLVGALPNLRLTMLDFSDAMHELARRRLSGHLEQVQFLTRDFKESGWSAGLGKFDAVITNQAVHELRHKVHAAGLHGQVKNLLNVGAPYIVSDHFFGDDGLSDDQLYLTIDEHRQALFDAGFEAVQLVVSSGSLVVHRAETTGES